MTYSIGDRVVILPPLPNRNLSPDFAGKHGVVADLPAGTGVGKYDIQVKIDDGPDASTDGWEIPLYSDEVEPEPVEAVVPDVIKVEDTFPFQPGDRVVYTIPETFSGVSGAEAAAQEAGTRGTVITQPSSVSVLVHWEGNARPTRTAIEFIAHAPAPTHQYLEGLYRGGTGNRVFVEHENAAGRYRFTYLDERDERDRAVVNHHLSESVLQFYTLIAEAPRA